MCEQRNITRICTRKTLKLALFFPKKHFGEKQWKKWRRGIMDEECIDFSVKFPGLGAE